MRSLRCVPMAGFVALVAFIASCHVVVQVESQCSQDRLVVYQVTMKTYWSREIFPKHYPEFRPPAQWSKLVGRTHNSGFSLFRLGGMASQGLKKFAETSSADVLDEASQGNDGVLDAFNGAPIGTGVGQSETEFFVDGNHTLVEPIDAGTDSGFTFTAPNWITVPQEAIHHIHSSKLHPAHSFQYPDNRVRDKAFATFTIIKMKEYSLSQWGASRINDEGNSLSPSYDSTSSVGSDPLLLRHHHHHHHLFADDIDSNDIGNELNEISDPKDVEDLALRKSKRKRSRKMKGPYNKRVPADCSVSEWSEWSECSALCGFGEQYRHRYVTSPSKNGGAVCPYLTDKRLCNSARDCRLNYFDW